MDFETLLKVIARTANNKKISATFICGGLPRDRVLGKINYPLDLDITTGDHTIHRLANEIYKQFPKADYKILNDGHAQVIIDGFKIDFSSNFRIPDIANLLKRARILNPTEMQMELYSRDFTCNALLMSMDLKHIYDPTGLGFEDLKLKRIRTCLPASITLGFQNKRVIRILYLAAKLGFKVDEEIIDWVKNNPSSIENVSKNYLSQKLKSAIKYNKERTIELLTEMNLWDYIPPLPELIHDFKFK